jgi:hypothetical protein
MVRHGLFAASLILLAGIVSAQSDPAHPIQPTGRQQDVYAIYSLLMPGAVFANLGSDKNQSWAIADTTVNSDDIDPALAPEAALKPPDDHPKWFHDAVVDYEEHRKERQTVTHNFHLDRPYTLLTQTEVQEFRTSRTTAGPGNDLKQKYSGYPGINFFSDVYFNPHRSAALVYTLGWCSNFCGQGEWVYLEKHDGQWARRSGQGAVVSGAKPF